jgi:formylglycine-generating enzyme required for sulfatase activity
LNAFEGKGDSDDLLLDPFRSFTAFAIFTETFKSVCESVGNLQNMSSTNGSINTKSVGQPGTVMTNSIGMKLTWIPPGTFQMGSTDRDDEKPIHTVTITKGFYMGVYEVTQEQYQKVMRYNPSQFKGNDNLPVEMVRCNDAVEFCKYEGKKYRLPTEAEWEYACRAGTTSTYGFDDSESQLGDFAWYDENSGDKTHPVGEKKPNAWGLYDMPGNVCEWCQDGYESGWYSKSPVENPLNGDKKLHLHVLRGGGCRNVADVCRVSGRGRGGIWSGSGYIGGNHYQVQSDISGGFRVVLDL